MQGRVHERRNVKNTTLGRQRAHGHDVDENREYGEDRVAAVTDVTQQEGRTLHHLITFEHSCQRVRVRELLHEARDPNRSL